MKPQPIVELLKHLDTVMPPPGSVWERLARCPTWVVDPATYSVLQRAAEYRLTRPAGVYSGPSAFNVTLRVDRHLARGTIVGMERDAMDKLMRRSEEDEAAGGCGLVVVNLEGV
jgi:hypothetical protein